MKKLLLFITVITMANVGFYAYGMEEPTELRTLQEQEKLDSQLFNAVTEFRKPHKSLLVEYEDDTQKVIDLIADGANPNAIDQKSGMAPLHVIFSPGAGVPKVLWADIVKLLLDGGANPNITSKEGWTPLHQAVRYNDTQATKLLFDAGADPTIKITEGEHMGKSPLDFAKGKNKKIITILFSHTTPEEVQHIIPFLTMTTKQRTQKSGKNLPLLTKDMRKYIAQNYLVKDLVNEKLEKAKKYILEYNEETLRKAIEDSVQEAIKKMPAIKEISD